MVSLEEMKNYLRVDHEDDDTLISHLIAASEKQCKDILRTEEDAELENAENGKIAVMYTAAYLYEHREEADHHALNLTLRAGRRDSDGYFPFEPEDHGAEKYHHGG